VAGGVHISPTLHPAGAIWTARLPGGQPSPIPTATFAWVRRVAPCSARWHADAGRRDPRCARHGLAGVWRDVAGGGLEHEKHRGEGGGVPPPPPDRRCSGGSGARGDKQDPTSERAMSRIRKHGLSCGS